MIDMKPSRTLLFLLVVFAILLILSLVFPANGIKLWGDKKLTFPDIQSVFKREKVQYADISAIIENSQLNEDTTVVQDTITGDSLLSIQVNNDSITKHYDTVRADAVNLSSSLERLQYPDNNHGLLYPFFRELDGLRDTAELIRVLHYGDSQIEGDRITSYIRNRLQKKFGGSGPGILSAAQLYNGQLSVYQENSDNWHRYTAFGEIDTAIEHHRYGFMASFARFSPYLSDSIQPDTVTKSAWITFRRSALGYITSRTYDRCRIFYGYNKKPFIAEIEKDGEIEDAEMIPPKNDLSVLEWDFNSSPVELTIKFTGTDSPDFYGVALDNHRGIAVDNIALRGSSGLVFTRMNRMQLKKLYAELNVKLLILQFGGNVVPYLTNNYDFYGKKFYNQLKRLRSINPDIPIIVIGVADMSRKVNDHYESYPNIEEIRDVMREASFRAGCAYWDLYDAMGGHNSMPSWVFAEPTLASTDFVHFNHRGARIVAKMFCNALFSDYYAYRKVGGSKENKN